MDNKYEKITKAVNDMALDFEKFYEKENKAAGTRIRKGMQNLKKIAQEIRIDVQEKKETM